MTTNGMSGSNGSNGSVLAAGAVADITPGIGLPMGGYGARQGVASGIRNPLLARVMVVSDGTTELAIAVCDLVGVGDEMVAGAREIIEAEAGIPASNVLVGATHTHSGPAGIRGKGSADYIAVTARKIAGAVIEAKARLQPVTLKVGTVEVTTISQNRRDPEGPIETVATILLAAPPDGGPAVATLVNYACHSTVFEHDNLDYSPDFPGAMARFIERELGGTAVYLQGAAGNINPVWMRHDAAEVERVGGILGAAATRTAHELRPLGEGQWCINLNWSEDVPKEAAPGSVLGDVSLASSQAFIDLPRRDFVSQDTLGKEIATLEAERKELLLSAQTAARAVADDEVARRRALTARINQLRIEWLISGRASEMPTSQRLELQAMRFSSDCALISLPGEFFVEIGHRIRDQVGIENLLIGGYSNGMVGYVPTAEAFAEAGYEVGCAQFEPDAADRITALAVSTVRALL
jgi:neutral ceramidase